jgi:hypothetical protein
MSCMRDSDELFKIRIEPPVKVGISQADIVKDCIVRCGQVLAKIQ